MERDISPGMGHPLIVAIGLAIFQQITGINAIIYYANQIFASAGFASAESQAIVTTWAILRMNTNKAGKRGHHD